MFGKKNKSEIFAEALSNLGKTIGVVLAEEEKQDASNRAALFDLVKKCQSWDELNEVIAKYSEDVSSMLENRVLGLGAA
jgi:hypothetical protein